MGFPQPAFATTVEISPFFFPFLETIKGAVRKGPQGGINQGSSATNSAIGTPCSSITYRSAMPDILILPITNGCYHAAPTVSDRVSRLSTGLASRLAYDLNSFMILSGRRSASTIICTWLDLTYAASRFHPRVDAMPLDGRQHHWPGGFVEYIRILEHFSPFCYDTFGVGFQHPVANQIVMPIHRSRFVAVQARSVAGERNEIRQPPLPYSCGSVGRVSVWCTATLGFPRFACIPTNLSLPMSRAQIQLAPPCFRLS